MGDIDEIDEAHVQAIAQCRGIEGNASLDATFSQGGLGKALHANIGDLTSPRRKPESRKSHRDWIPVSPE
jgi:hypothetical protein